MQFKMFSIYAWFPAFSVHKSNATLSNIIIVFLVGEEKTVADSSFFKYKSSVIGKSTAVGGNRVFKNIEIAVPIKYFSKRRGRINQI